MPSWSSQDPRAKFLAIKKTQHVFGQDPGHIFNFWPVESACRLFQELDFKICLLSWKDLKQAGIKYKIKHQIKYESTQLLIDYKIYHLRHVDVA